MYFRTSKKRTMIKFKIETTNNAAIIKYVSDKVITDKHFEYQTIEDAENSPLAQHLFRLPFVKKVLISSNFIAIERNNLVEWKEVQDDLKGILNNYFIQNKPVFSEDFDKKKSIEIYAETTPNPDTQKFVTNTFLTSQNIEIKSVEESKDVPLAFELFEYPFVKKVFISQNYISITKDETLEWFEMSNEIRDFLKLYLESSKNIISKDFSLKATNKKIENKSDKTNTQESNTSKEIIRILDEYIKPAVASDGGNIKFESYNEETKEVLVTLQGACNGCPSATITLKNGIEATLKNFLGDEIDCVNALN